MAEYIDKKYLDRKFQIDMMAFRGGTIFDTRNIIDSLPTADVIEREKINKAREEIKQNAYPIVHGVNNRDIGMTLDGIFQVLDKLIAESED